MGKLHDVLHEVVDGLGMHRLHEVIDADAAEQEAAKSPVNDVRHTEPVTSDPDDNKVKDYDSNVKSGDSVTVEKEGSKDEDDS